MSHHLPLRFRVVVLCSSLVERETVWCNAAFSFSSSACFRETWWPPQALKAAVNPTQRCLSVSLSEFFFPHIPDGGRHAGSQHGGSDDTGEGGGSVLHIWFACPWKRMVGGFLCPWRAVSGDQGSGWYPHLPTVPVTVTVTLLLLSETASPAAPRPLPFGTPSGKLWIDISLRSLFYFFASRFAGSNLQ